MLDLLSKELDRLIVDQRLRELVHRAREERRMREVEESSRRQWELRRRREQEEFFKQVRSCCVIIKTQIFQKSHEQGDHFNLRNDLGFSSVILINFWASLSKVPRTRDRKLDLASLHYLKLIAITDGSITKWISHIFRNRIATKAFWSGER